MFLFYISGGLFLALVVAIKPSLVYKAIYHIEAELKPGTVDDHKKILVYSLMMYFGLLFPVIFLVEIILVAWSNAQ